MLHISLNYSKKFNWLTKKFFRIWIIVELVDQRKKIIILHYLIELTANIDVSVLSDIALWKPYGAAHPRHGSRKLFFLIFVIFVFFVVLITDWFEKLSIDEILINDEMEGEEWSLNVAGKCGSMQEGTSAHSILITHTQYVGFGFVFRSVWVNTVPHDIKCCTTYASHSLKIRSISR